MEIKKAEFKDMEEILTLQKSAFLSEAQLYDNYTFDAYTQTLDSIQTDFEKYHFLKYVQDNKIIGSVKFRDTGEFCWIGRLIVHPDFQNQGIGKKLMCKVEELNPNAIQFVLYAGMKSMKNIKLYESIGYRIVEQFQDEKIKNLITVKMIKTNSSKG